MHRVPLGRELPCPEIAARGLVQAAQLPVTVTQIKHRALPRFQRLKGIRCSRSSAHKTFKEITASTHIHTPPTRRRCKPETREQQFYLFYGVRILFFFLGSSGALSLGERRKHGANQADAVSSLIHLNTVPWGERTVHRALDGSFSGRANEGERIGVRHLR